jgi:glycosyltransferase involved in cell wall biosynthesis
MTCRFRSDHSPMKVSAVIPAFNRRRYIARAIDSVMHQTVPVDEVLVIDDGSTDGTAETVRSRYGDAVKVIRQPNSGAARARCRGIEEARGEWIAFLDSDDEWTPSRNRDLLEAAERVPTDVAWIFGDLRVVTDDSESPSFFEEHGLTLSECPQVISDPLSIQYPTLFSYLQASLIRREALLELNCFQEGLRSEDDVLAAFQVGCRYKFAAISRAVVKYYRTSDLVSSSVAINGLSHPDAYRARMIAFATAIKCGRGRPWKSEYASAVRGLCMALDNNVPSSRALALEQFRYGGFSLKGVAFMCVALTGRWGIRLWKAVSASRKRTLCEAEPTRVPSSVVDTSRRWSRSISTNKNSHITIRS